MKMRLIIECTTFAKVSVILLACKVGGKWRHIEGSLCTVYFIVIVAAATVALFVGLLAAFPISIIPLVNHLQIHNSIMVQFIHRHRAQYKTQNMFM